MAAITTTKQQDSSGNTSLSTTESFQEKTKIHNDDVLPLTPSEWRKLRWRLDLRIVLVFALIYMWSAMDRSNIGKLDLTKNMTWNQGPGAYLLLLYDRKCQAW